MTWPVVLAVLCGAFLHASWNALVATMAGLLEGDRRLVRDSISLRATGQTRTGGNQSPLAVRNRRACLGPLRAGDPARLLCRDRNSGGSRLSGEMVGGRTWGDHFRLGDFAILDLGKDVDVVLMRQDPPFDLGYITATHLLERGASCDGFGAIRCAIAPYILARRSARGGGGFGGRITPLSGGW